MSQGPEKPSRPFLLFKKASLEDLISEVRNTEPGHFGAAQRATQSPISVECLTAQEFFIQETAPDLLTEIGDQLFPIDNSSEPDQIVPERIRTAKLQEAVENLPPQLKEVVELRFGFIDGLSRSQQEVAELTGISRQTVVSREQKALRLLRHPQHSRRYPYP